MDVTATAGSSQAATSLLTAGLIRPSKFDRQNEVFYTEDSEYGPPTSVMPQQSHASEIERAVGQILAAYDQDRDGAINSFWETDRRVTQYGMNGPSQVTLGIERLVIYADYRGNRDGVAHADEIMDLMRGFDTEGGIDFLYADRIGGVHEVARRGEINDAAADGSLAGSELADFLAQFGETIEGAEPVQSPPPVQSPGNPSPTQPPVTPPTPPTPVDPGPITPPAPTNPIDQLKEAIEELKRTHSTVDYRTDSIMRRFDGNKDGQLQLNGFLGIGNEDGHFLGDSIQRLAACADRLGNRDGHASRAEIHALLSRYDTNADGMISSDSTGGRPSELAELQADYKDEIRDGWF